MKTLDDNYADVAGYHTTLKALHRDPRFQPRADSPVIGLSNSQLFYVSLCFKWCTTKRNLFSNSTEFPRPDHRCNIALSTAAGFKKAFGCTQDTDELCDM